MKKLFFVAGFMACAVFFQPVFAATTMQVAGAMSEDSSSAAIPKVEYFLPYPGMLPDHPLYALKNIRDRIIELLISDPVNKGEFYILQADKKLQMGSMLFHAGKNTEAEEIFAQSEIHRKRAVDTLTEAAESGITVPGFVTEKLIRSLDKHQEFLTDLNRSSGNIDALREEAGSVFPSVR